MTKRFESQIDLKSFTKLPRQLLVVVQRAEQYMLQAKLLRWMLNAVDCCVYLYGVLNTLIGVAEWRERENASLVQCVMS